MGKDGSANQPSALSPLAALVAWAIGVPAMMVAAGAAVRLGLRPALVVAEACLALPALAAMALWGISWTRGLALVRPSVRGALLALVAGGAFWAGSLGLLQLQYAVWPPPPGFLDGFQALHRALRPAGVLDGAFSVAAIAVAPALGEEILFRGALLPAFVRLLRPWGAIALSALLFGIIHVDVTSAGAYTLYRVPFAIAVGIALGVLRVRSGSLTPCILAHSALNTITFLAVFLTAPSAEPEAANVLEGAAFFVVGGAASALLLRLHSRAPAA